MILIYDKGNGMTIMALGKFVVLGQPACMPLNQERFCANLLT
jgi:hypothetical protein